MNKNFTFTLKRSCFDENYNPSENTRTTTNFANLARGEKRQENLRNTLVMINNRFNALARWDNPKSDRYSVELEIVSVDMNVGDDNSFPAIEILQTFIVDKETNERVEGIVGNNFLHTYATMTSAYCCSITIKINPDSASHITLVICMATSLSTLHNPLNTSRTSKSRQ
jgi:hypothetical protein